MSLVDFTIIHKKIFPLVFKMHLREDVAKTEEYKKWLSIIKEIYGQTGLYYHYRSFCMAMFYIKKNGNTTGRFSYKELTPKGRECLTHETCDDCDYKFQCAFDLDVHNPTPGD